MVAEGESDIHSPTIQKLNGGSTTSSPLVKPPPSQEVAPPE